jgi:hypothetical protein
LNAIELLEQRRQHVARLANERGAGGELSAMAEQGWIPRPKGGQMKLLLALLREAGVNLKPSSFDAIALPIGMDVDFGSEASIRAALPAMTFIEIKTASQPRVTEDFSGFFFALTEAEIAAASALGNRHRVALYNRQTGSLRLTSVDEIVKRAKSMTWQLSVQL